MEKITLPFQLLKSGCLYPIIFYKHVQKGKGYGGIRHAQQPTYIIDLPMAEAPLQEKERFLPRGKKWQK